MGLPARFSPQARTHSRLGEKRSDSENTSQWRGGEEGEGFPPQKIACDLVLLLLFSWQEYQSEKGYINSPRYVFPPRGVLYPPSLSSILRMNYCSQWRISRAVVTVVTKRFVLLCLILLPSPFSSERNLQKKKDKYLHIKLLYI